MLAVVGAAAFISILWTVGGSYTLDLGTLGPVTIPAYMVIVALAYGIIASGLMLWVGAPLVGFVGRKNEAEGYFRFAMMRIRDNAESVALMNGARYEQAVLGRFYETVVARWMAIVWQHGHLTWITNSSGPMIPIIPLLFAAPKYISGELTLGQVTQLAAAFVQVQIAISWVVDNYNRVAEWYASRAPRDGYRRRLRCHRRRDRGDIARADATQRGAGRRRAPRATSRSPTAPAGRCCRAPICRPAPGEAVHVHGDSSTGKSTLVRVLAGLWPVARGGLTLPDRSEVMITPQKSYLPLGSLKGALLYPNPDAADVRRPPAGRARQGRTSARSAAGSTRWRAGTRCSPTASASASPSPGCSSTGPA